MRTKGEEAGSNRGLKGGNRRYTYGYFERDYTQLSGEHVLIISSLDEGSLVFAI